MENKCSGDPDYDRDVERKIMRNKVIDLLDQTIEELDKEKIDGILEIPPKDDMGDFAFPCFQLAKVFRKAPNMIATEIAEKIPASEDVSKVEAMGPYVNFFLNKENYVKEVLAKVNGTYGAQEIGKGKQYVSIILLQTLQRTSTLDI